MKTRDPNEKEMARERERKDLAEQMKQEARNQNAAARQAAGGGGGYDGGDSLGYGAADVNRGYTATGVGYNRGDPRGGFGKVNRRFTAMGTGYADNVGYAGDTTGGYTYSTTGAGGQDYRGGEYETRNWDDREGPNNAAGTRRNTRAGEDPYGTYG